MANILLKNIPKQIHVEIKKRADRNHRSINSEIISCLESILTPTREEPELELEKARLMRKKVRGFLTQEILQELKNTGRV